MALLCLNLASANTFYHQLCEFNFNWKKYEQFVPLENSKIFNSDKEYIQAHLNAVLSILRSNKIDHLSCTQIESRIKLIEILTTYKNVGKFPINYHCKNRIPVFIDENNTYCAVGFLLKQSGYDNLACEIAAKDNYIWVKDISHPQLLEWQKQSGFTLEELELIQGAYDFYMPNAFTLPNKYEIPQQPQVIVAYFEDKDGKKLPYKNENIWLKGSSLNGKLNGRWEQNYAVGIPWIVGYYENGKRSGQWEEYYKGTKVLCRTENWRNDKLNGIRKRFDMDGRIIEEINFKDGEAVVKTNYDFKDSLTWIRKPLDSNIVSTEVYTFGGSLIAYGNEKVHNPSGLLWFQNIELTALNSASISSRVVVNDNDLNLSNDAYLRRQHSSGFSLFSQTPQLVEYKKEGEWKFYKDYKFKIEKIEVKNTNEMLVKYYSHFGSQLLSCLSMSEGLAPYIVYDSITVQYANNRVNNFYGYNEKDFTHLQIVYHTHSPYSFIIPAYYYYSDIPFEENLPIKTIGFLNIKNQKMGLWKHYDEYGTLYKTENFIIPKDEEDYLSEK